MLTSQLTDGAARRIATYSRGGRPRGLPPGCNAAPPLQLLAFLYRPTVFLRACRARYGASFSLRLPNLPPIVSFSDPSAIKEVFAAGADVLHAGEANSVLEPFLGAHSVLVLDGRAHAAQRKLLLPPFRGERMRAFGETMRDITRVEMSRWPMNETFCMQPETQTITLGVILRTVFGMEEGRELDTMRPLLVEALGALANPLYLVRSFQRDLGRHSPWGRFLRTRGQIYAAMDSLVRERRREPDERADVLSSLLGAKHEDGTPMSDAEIRDELLTLLVAGHETTATALSWAIHRLTMHADVLQRVWKELDDTFVDGEVDTARIRELTYLDAFVKEVLRVHPVIPGVGRVVKKPIEIGGCRLEPGTAVICSIYLAHFDATSWPDPERFDPGRFLGTHVSPSVYFPFGGGLRRCIGEAFAHYEMQVVLATLLTKLEPIGVDPDVRTVRRNITLTPSGGLPIQFRPRRGGASHVSA